MTIRFAAARGGTTPAIARALCPGAPLGAVNDNPRVPRAGRIARAVPLDRAQNEGQSEGQNEAQLAAALMHFARHGLSAAARARAEAEAAHHAGDGAARTHWLGICRQLDRRMAEATERRIAR